MRMLLLVSAVTLLVSPTVGRSLHDSDVIQLNLNSIYDLAEKCSASHTTEFFVEDVSHLAEGKHKCGDKFFCKVHNILQNHEGVCKKEVKDVLVRTLQMYNRGKNVQCDKVLHGMPSEYTESESSRLLGYVKHCVQHRNLNST